MRIVLAHGFLGFGAVGMLPLPQYFNGIAALLRARGHEVIAPSVSALGTLEQRSSQLAQAIGQRWPDGEEPVTVIGHSMGGLDARRVAARYPQGAAIRHIICIGSPLLGSPVVDAMLDQRHSLHAAIPGWLFQVLSMDQGAMQDLRTRNTPHDPERDDVLYQEISCEPCQNSHSPLFGLTRAIGQFAGSNDGVVCRNSATRPQRKPLACWPVDHCEAIGWPTRGLEGLLAAFNPPSDHIARYTELAEYLEYCADTACANEA